MPGRGNTFTPSDQHCSACSGCSGFLGGTEGETGQRGAEERCPGASGAMPEEIVQGATGGTK